MHKRTPKPKLNKIHSKAFAEMKKKFKGKKIPPFLIPNLANAVPISKLLTALHRRKSTDEILKLIAAEKDLESHDNSGNTALIKAIEKRKSAEIVMALIKAGARLNARNEDHDPALSLVIKNRLGLEVVKAFIEAGADINILNKKSISPLHTAIYYGKNDIAKALIEAGANVNTRREDTRESPLLSVASDGDKEIADLLIKNGAELEAIGLSLNTPLLKAFNRGSGLNDEFSASIPLQLIKAGANVNAQNAKGNTALLLAVQRGAKNKLKLIKELLQAGADPNVENSDRDTILHRLSNYHSPDGISSTTLEIVDLLIKSGANVDAVNKSGLTPLCICARMGNFEIAEKLINAGANVNFKNVFGITPMVVLAQTSYMYGNPKNAKRVDKIAAMFEKHGAKLDISQAEKNKLLKYALEKKGALKIVSFLLKAGADPYAEIGSGRIKTNLIEDILKYGDKPELIRILKEAGVDFESKNRKPLHLVLGTWGKGELAKVKALIDIGVDVNSFNDEWETPLTVAIKNRRSKEVLTALIEAGADLEKVKRGMDTILMAAVRSRSVKPEDISFLIKSGIKLNGKDWQGTTPLMVAAEKNGAEKIIIPMLLKAGADIEAKDEGEELHL